MFSPATIEAIKFYVYALADEKDQIFYVGKGKGNRVFQHVQEVKDLIFNKNSVLIEQPEADDSDVNGLGLRRQKIADILRSGEEPRMYIIREGLTDDQALLVEASLISVLDWQLQEPLTNQVEGHGTSHSGLKTVDELEATKGEAFNVKDLPDVDGVEEIIAININRRWQEVVQKQSSLLDVSKGIWKVKIKRAKECPYAVIHSNGIVRGVFKIKAWHQSVEKDRYYFEPEENEPLVGNQFRQKNASSIFGFRAAGSQNPIRYVKINKNNLAARR